jgi:TfoX/Sxy family transcriptional regulator of competence genes
MAFDEGLAQRVREVLGSRPGISERRMFGGLAFLVDGKMFVGLLGAVLMARVGAERHRDALAMPHVREMDFTGKPMKGYVYIDPPAIEADNDLSAWVIWCEDHARRLPPKKASARATAAPNRSR